MDNIKIVSFTDEVTGVTTETVLIDKGDGNFVSMLKAAYDEMIANQQSGTIS